MFGKVASVVFRVKEDDMASKWPYRCWAFVTFWSPRSAEKVCRLNPKKCSPEVQSRMVLQSLLSPLLQLLLPLLLLLLLPGSA